MTFWRKDLLGEHPLADAEPPFTRSENFSGRSNRDRQPRAGHPQESLSRQLWGTAPSCCKTKGSASKPKPCIGKALAIGRQEDPNRYAAGVSAIRIGDADRA